MLPRGAKLKVIDNSGGLLVEFFGTIRYSRIRHVTVGHIITVAVKKAVPNAKVKSGDVCKAMIVTTKYPVKDKYGTMSFFTDNSVVLLNHDLTPKGTFVNGFISKKAVNCSSLPALTKLLSSAKGVY